MTDEVAKALANDQIIDITTIGRKSGESRRIEIWFHRLDGRYYITGTPNRPRSWYANLVANPAFIFHLKQTTKTDVSATARPITERGEREKVFAGILPPLGDLIRTPGQEPAIWVADSPLVEVVFTG
jgi:deazaflavin-dependent oxidoreductase (nitroreductase family)